MAHSNIKWFLLIISFIGISSEIKSQSILAGQHGPHDYYYKFNPDSVVFCNWPPCNIISFPIDINNDGIVDFTCITNNNQGGMGGWFRYARIRSNNSQIAAGYSDTCIIAADSTCPYSTTMITPIVKSFPLNNSIDKYNTWNSDSLYMKYSDYTYGCPSCNGGALFDSLHLIGVRIFVNSDTLYGWIRLKNFYMGSWTSYFTIIDYACNLNSAAGIIENSDVSLFQFRGNPFKTSSQIALNQTYHSIVLAVYDIQGKLVEQLQYEDCSQIQFNRNRLSNGLYFVKITLDDKCLETGKFVVVDE
jgi:hypothetical protein